MGLGSAATGRVTLATARKMAQAARDLLVEGKDPQAVKRASKQSARQVRSFGQVADEYLKIMSKGWRNAKHKAQWERSLKELAAPLDSQLVLREFHNGEERGKGTAFQADPPLLERVTPPGAGDHSRPDPQCHRKQQGGAAPDPQALRPADQLHSHSRR